MSELSLGTVQLVPALVPSRLPFMIIYHSMGISLNRRHMRPVIKAYDYAFFKSFVTFTVPRVVCSSYGMVPSVWSLVGRCVCGVWLFTKECVNVTKCKC